MNKFNRRIYIRITQNEYDELMKQKDFLGFSSYSNLIRAYIHTGICYRIDYNGLFEVATQISRIGNNINQIANVANMTCEVTSEQVKELKSHMAELDKIMSYDFKEIEKVTRRLSEDFFVGE